MEDKLIVEILDSKYEQAHNKFRDGDANHDDLTVMMLKHQTNNISHLELNIAHECKDVRIKIKDVRHEIKDVRHEINNLRDTVQKEFKDVRNAMKSKSNKNLTIIGLMLVVMTAVITIVPLLNK